jgi:hypothetical protein
MFSFVVDFVNSSPDHLSGIGRRQFNKNMISHNASAGVTIEFNVPGRKAGKTTSWKREAIQCELKIFSGLDSIFTKFGNSVSS